MLKWLKSLFGGEKKEEAVNTENSGDMNAQASATENMETPAEPMPEDVAPGVSSDESASEEAEAPEAPAEEVSEPETSGSDEEKTSM